MRAPCRTTSPSRSHPASDALDVAPAMRCSRTAVIASGRTSSIASRMVGSAVWRARRAWCVRSAMRPDAVRGREPLRVSDPATVSPRRCLRTRWRRASSAPEAYLMADMMSDVIKRGTGRRASRRAQRHRGKTGTTMRSRTPGSTASPQSRGTCGWASTRSVRSGGRGGCAHRAADLDPVHARSAAGLPEQQRTMPDGWSPCGSPPDRHAGQRRES